MPANTADTSGKAARAQAASGPSRRTSRARTAPLQTFAEATGSRNFVPRNPQDEQQARKSFYIPEGTIQRLRATILGIQARTYGKPLADRAPDSMSALLDEAVNAICTYYEDILNDGEEFERIHRLAPGPSLQGAARGAAKRSARRSGG